ncbi:MAG: 50S ribosomal protein L4 [Phycicoccus sp.]
MATSTLTVDLPAEIFDVQTNVPLIHQVVVAQLAAARQGTHATKTRGEVRGGGRKPYRQKGTGRARQGSTRAPQFAGGGTVHGPQPRDYSQRTPKKMKAAALRGALSDRARHERIHVVASIAAGDAPSTKDAKALLGGLTERTNLLVVLDRSDIASLKSVRNLENVHVLAVDQLNTYDVLCADDVVFTKAAFDTFVGAVPATETTEKVVEPATAAEVDEPATAAKADEPVEAAKADEPVEAAKTTGAAKTDEPARTAEVDVPEEAHEPPTTAGLPAGAVAALADGSAPEGYTVKGNGDSGLYHLPGGRWYESTVAEFWFEDEAAAQAAGLTKAGTRKKSPGHAAGDGVDGSDNDNGPGHADVAGRGDGVDNDNGPGHADVAGRGDGVDGADNDNGEDTK